MSAKKTTSEFIEEATKVHFSRYDYTLVDYQNCKEKVIIICNTHGEFECSPNNHLRGKGCKKCHNEKITKIKPPKAERNLTEEFIVKAIKIHGEDYNYDLVEYKDAKSKVIIKCKKHNHVFEQSPTNHLSGFGCMTCARIKQADSKRKDLVWFVEKATEVHGDKYNYTNTEYIESHKKVNIECKNHGTFRQSPNAHIAGKGCEKCARILNSFIREDYVKMAKGRDTILYLLKCFNEEEEFYKIGKTYTSIKQRYKKGAIPYEYVVLDTFTSDASTIHKKEADLHMKYGMYNYTPKLKFGGHTECYSENLPLNNTLDK